MVNLVEHRALLAAILTGLALCSVSLFAAPVEPDNKKSSLAPGLSDALMGQLTLPKQDQGLEDAEESARQSAEFFLAPDYAPPRQSRFAAIPTNGKDTVDRMLIRYDAKGATIALAQTMWVFSVQIERPEWAKIKVPLKSEDILAQARMLFKNGGATKEGGKLKVMLEDGLQGMISVDWGKNGRPAELERAHVTTPFEGVLWQQDGGRLTFWLSRDTDPLTVKAAVWSGDLMPNMYWFSAKPDANWGSGGVLGMGFWGLGFWGHST
jgi:hypothetical protein